MKQEKNQLKIGIVLNYVNMVIGNLIPIFYTPIMLTLLGQNEYGLYKLSSNITSYLSLVSLGLGAAITRYLIKAREEEGKDAEERILGLFNIIFQIIAVLTFIIGICLILNLDILYSVSLTESELMRMRIIVFILVCNTALSFLLSPSVSVVTAHERFIFLQCMNIVSTCVGPLFNIILLYLGFASIGMAFSSLTIGVISRLIYWVYVKHIMGIHAQYKHLPISLLKEIMAFSFWIFVANIVAQLYNATDTVMIGMIPALSTSGVAVYNIGSTFNGIANSLTTGISSLLSPKANKLVLGGASNNELTNFAIRIGRFQGYISALVVTGFIAFGRPFISFYVGEHYNDAYWVAICLMIPNIIPLVQSLCLSILVAQNKHRFRSIVYLGMAILNVVGTWILMHYMGVIGAALISGIALVLGNGFIMNWYYQKHVGLNIILFWKKVIPIFIVPSIICWFALIISRYINFYQLPVLFFCIILYTTLYCILTWFFVMNDSEKQLIIKPVQSIIKKIHKGLYS